MYRSDEEKEQFFEDVTERLKNFGYTYDQENDEFIINFIIKQVTHTIQSECNIDCIPTELYEKAINVVCGEFLYEKRSSGNLDLESINEDNIIASVKEGDTQVNFSTDSPSSGKRFDTLLDVLIASITESDYASFRRFKW